MRKIGKWICLSALLALLLTMAGCSGNTEEDGERTALDFTVVDIRQIPEELSRVIEEHREEEMQIVFLDKDDLYAVRGYGEQDTGGYSISVDECSEGKEKIHIATTLIGPSPNEKISKSQSYPVIVLKLQMRDKEVQFE